LFIDVTEQKERLDTHLGGVQTALEQAPKVLHAVGVTLPIHILLGMVDNLMDDFSSSPQWATSSTVKTSDLSAILARK